MTGTAVSTFARYCWTLRYLKPVQIYGRAWFRLFRPGIDTSAAPPVCLPTGIWSLPARRIPSLLPEGQFRFLNEVRDLARHGWDDPATGLLWRYNLHYFDDLNAWDARLRADAHCRLLEHWVMENAPGHGTGWAPYPCSLRIVNWIKWQLNGNSLQQLCIDSLAVQARWLRRRLEYHLLGNHLFVNAKALVFAGLFFEGDEAQAWLRKGLDLLDRQVPEQILADGGQFERSPMYHALALEDVLDVINVVNYFPGRIPHRYSSFVASLPDVARRMRVWLREMCHPDGEIAFFNDAAMGVAPAPSELDRYATDLAIEVPSRHIPDPEAVPRLVEFRDSGYLRAEVPDAVLLMDVAPVGPDYLPGHAHADTLSFEFSLFGERVIVNRGTSQYGTGPAREDERGTAAHSTVTVNGQNSSDVWAGFRVGRRARPSDLMVEAADDRLVVSCAHDGYLHLPGRPRHRRTWHLERGRLQVSDRIEGAFESAITRFHFPPAVVCTLGGTGNDGMLRLAGERVAFWRLSAGSARLEKSFYCPCFGTRIPSTCLAVHFDSTGEITFELNW